mgnify:CR=1 FL=1
MSRLWVYEVIDSFEAKEDSLRLVCEDGSKVLVSNGNNLVSYGAREAGSYITFRSIGEAY